MGSKPGRKPGPGRPKRPKTFSDKFKKAMWSAIESDAKAHGQSIFEFVVERVRTEPHGSYAASIFRTICEVMASKESSAVVTKIETGPTIGLPPLRRDDDKPVVVIPKALVQ